MGPAAGLGAPSFFSLVQPKYPGARGAFVFPPSCDMIPDPIGKVQCEDFKKGAMLFWKEEACVAMPIESGNQACRNEREVLRKLGAENAARMRKEAPDWWRTPYLNTYVYGDTRLRTEELGPTASVWGGGSHAGWRDDEIFLTHAAGVRKIVSHSFGYVGGNDLDAMRDRLIKDEGISIKGPQDLQRPEVVRIRTDLAYLQQHSKIYQAIVGAEAKDFDGNTVTLSSFGQVTTVFMDATVPAYRDYLISYYKGQVDADADGVFFDDETGHDPSHSFNPDTLRRFAVWLAANRPPALTTYGVSAPASLNYRDFLKSRGFTKAAIDDAVGPTIGASEAWRSIPLMTEFRTFLVAENQRALTDIVAAIRRYASEKGRNDLVITGNAGELAPSGAFTVPLFDYLTFEHGYPKGGDLMGYQSAVPLTKLANAKERPATNEIVSGGSLDWLRYAKLAVPLRFDLLRLMVMESAAAHGANHYVRFSGIPPRTEKSTEADSYLALEDRTDLAEMKKAFGFIQKYRDAYRDIAQSSARVAILYDNAEVAREWRESMTGNHQGAAQEAARALWAKNVEFDIVNGKQLAARPYSLVFVPPSASLSAADAATLTGVRAGGGKVFALWSVAPGLAVDGRVDGEQIGSLGAQAARPLPLPDGVRSLRYVNEKGDVLIHLMNYDYGPDGFRVKKDLRLDPSAVGAGLVVSYASIEHPDLVTLDPKDPRVPELTTYGVVIAKRP